MNILKAAVDTGVDDLFIVVHLQFMATLMRPLNEKTPTNPISPYGAQKLYGKYFAKLSQAFTI